MSVAISAVADGPLAKTEEHLLKQPTERLLKLQTILALNSLPEFLVIIDVAVLISYTPRSFDWSFAEFDKRPDMILLFTLLWERFHKHREF